MRARLLVPQVKPLPADRPKACRRCGSTLLQRHQAVPKRIIDAQLRETQAVRYRCIACGRTFRHYDYHQERSWVPATNNRTEQAIGKSKVRFKTVLGFKSVAGALAGIALTQWLYSGAAEHDLAELVA